MRILVYGAGVQGCQLAHSLAQNKKNVVTLLARGEWKEVIDQKGLTIRHMLQRKTIFKDLKRKKWGEIHKMFINICYDTKDCNVWEKGRVFFRKGRKLCVF